MKYQVEKSQPLMEFLLDKSGKKKNDIKNLLKYGNIFVDGNKETHFAYVLEVGQVVEISTKKESLPFPILFEDSEFIVIDKPCGLLSEQTANESQKTAFYIVKEYLNKKKENVFLVHRLDQYTSGVLMFVKTKKLYDLLTHDWNHYVKTRGYIAIVEGQMPKQKDTIDTYLSESKTQNVFITSKDKGKRAITHYKQIKTNKRFSMLEVYLDTGRKNQIRVHLSSLHHPLVGDDKYGSRSNPLKRLGLHAHEFMFTHPVTHKEMRFVSKTPDVFDKLF
ncbi:MAG: RluA family pseudouridine synthase [Coprobacillus sp.]